MTREWKPGDVGVNEAHGYRGIFVQKCPTHERDCWHNESGFSDPATDIRRPLVVIDPEDESQVDALRDALSAAGGYMPTFVATRDALRSLIEPPKPEEPTGAGAVVEDAVGHHWVRIAAATEDPVGPHLEQASPPWRRRGATARWWDKVNAVKVLSEGIKP